MDTNGSAVPPVAESEPAATEVFQQIGLITRQLHDTLEKLGVMPKLQEAAVGLPDARSRLSYIAKKCGDAADKVLTSVDLAKADQAQVAEATERLARAVVANAAGPADAKALLEAIAIINAAQARTNSHLTDIMLAQDYHDLTGQVVAKVVALAIDLENSLVGLLVQAAPVDSAPRKADPEGLEGPVIDASSRTDVVADQGEVDDLLASLGF